MATTDTEQKVDDNSIGIFGQIEGLTAVDESDLVEFKRVMAEEVIPEILRVVEERRISAAESRQWHLKG